MSFIKVYAFYPDDGICTPENQINAFGKRHHGLLIGQSNAEKNRDPDGHSKNCDSGAKWIAYQRT